MKNTIAETVSKISSVELAIADTEKRLEGQLEVRLNKQGQAQLMNQSNTLGLGCSKPSVSWGKVPKVLQDRHQTFKYVRGCGLLSCRVWSLCV
eukprot:2565643-Amphidinium_carterae.1